MRDCTVEGFGGQTDCCLRSKGLRFSAQGTLLGFKSQGLGPGVTAFIAHVHLVLGFKPGITGKYIYTYLHFSLHFLFHLILHISGHIPKL